MLWKDSCFAVVSIAFIIAFLKTKHWNQYANLSFQFRFPSRDHGKKTCEKIRLQWGLSVESINLSLFYVVIGMQ